MILCFFMVWWHVSFYHWVSCVDCIVRKHQCLFIHSPARHTGFFQDSAVMNKAAVMFTCMFLSRYVFSSFVYNYLGAVLADHIVDDIRNCLPQWLCHFESPKAVSESSCSFGFLPAFGVLFVCTHCNRCAFVSHVEHFICWLAICCLVWCPDILLAF